MASAGEGIIIHGSKELDPKVWSPEAARSCVCEGLNALDNALRLYAIAFKLAPKGSALSDLLIHAYDDLAAGAEGIGMVFGIEIDAEALGSEN